jgi:hypothetical protein
MIGHYLNVWNCPVFGHEPVRVISAAGALMEPVAYQTARLTGQSGLSTPALSECQVLIFDHI